MVCGANFQLTFGTKCKSLHAPTQHSINFSKCTVQQGAIRELYVVSYTVQLKRGTQISLRVWFLSVFLVVLGCTGEQVYVEVHARKTRDNALETCIFSYSFTIFVVICPLIFSDFTHDALQLFFSSFVSCLYFIDIKSILHSSQHT